MLAGYLGDNGGFELDARQPVECVAQGMAGTFQNNLFYVVLYAAMQEGMQLVGFGSTLSIRRVDLARSVVHAYGGEQSCFHPVHPKKLVEIVACGALAVGAAYPDDSQIVLRPVIQG